VFTLIDELKRLNKDLDTLNEEINQKLRYLNALDDMDYYFYVNMQPLHSDVIKSILISGNKLLKERGE
jgi:hypothetical protein